jgi:membrane protease YdiL (CAAX protease family)
LRARASLYLSAAVILVYAAASVARSLLRPGALPDSVRELALYACLKAAVILAAVWLLLRASGEGLADLGLRSHGWGSTLLRGALLGLGIFVAETVLLNPLVAALLGGGGTAPAVKALFRDPREAPYWVVAAVVVGGFAEELERAFVLTRFERLFGPTGLALALAGDSVLFGLGHLYQGATAAVASGFTGLLFALVFLWRRRVGDAMVAHAAFDLVGVAAAYALYSGGA